MRLLKGWITTTYLSSPATRRCSSKGQVSLNLKLIQFDKSLIDYAILHEVCHLRKLNTAARFTRSSTASCRTGVISAQI
jgi:hypothetical protein